MDTLAIILITAGLACLLGAGIGYYAGYANGLEEYQRRYNRHLKRVLNEKWAQYERDAARNRQNYFDTDGMGRN